MRRSGLFPLKRRINSTFFSPRPRQVLMAFNRLGKLHAASAFLTQRPAGLRNLFRETPRTRSLMGADIFVCIKMKINLSAHGANRVKSQSANRAEREKGCQINITRLRNPLPMEWQNLGVHPIGGAGQLTQSLPSIEQLYWRSNGFHETNHCPAGGRQFGRAQRI
jgi:hypothetical protein